jgi:hypothetical protein
MLNIIVIIIEYFVPVKKDLFSAFENLCRPVPLIKEAYKWIKPQIINLKEHTKFQAKDKLNGKIHYDGRNSRQR